MPLTFIAPMEAKLVTGLPDETGWQFEPKWDGFRCLAIREGEKVALYAKSGKDLGRYFPEVVAMVAALPGTRFILDGELVVATEGVASFDDLQQRLHPAASRVRKLAAETPATFVVFDLLDYGADMSVLPLAERRQRLEAFVAKSKAEGLRLSPATEDAAVAQGWFEKLSAELDGVIAKRRDAPYAPGERAMLKIKTIRTADCVVGGFRYGKDSKEVGSLLLGLFDGDGKLHHVGFTSAIAAKDKPELTEKLEKLKGKPGFTGKAPGGPSRWSTERSSEWEPLRHELVVEVAYDQITGDRFRHGTRFRRWRPDKAPEQCTFAQLAAPAAPDAVIAGVLGKTQKGARGASVEGMWRRKD
ncbi:ATP-dependent DNA ligase [Devosia sediminis]|uniref:DNA ligase (ATP) n=1 Tax=Devosia sediminis TaxID=2798801 RepID=A0A934J119_9HYPH|nr:ATP-dependent DNA ligase [Devosia sediminis]MBJ3786313.1 ATP-dependent DNA ligase [Devosia sediminis]